MKIALALVSAVLLLSLIIYKWLDATQFGKSPADDPGPRILNSPNYDRETRTFRNQVPGDMRKDMKVWPLLKAYIFGDEIRVPSEPIPSVPPDLEAFLKADETQVKWLWLGHSTLYFNFHGVRVLVDPVFAPASPLAFMVKRFQKPVIDLKDLPEADVILLSHDHYDHLDAAAMRELAAGKARFLVPLGLGSRLRGWGLAEERMQELDWHERTVIRDMTFIASPAQHFSGRGLFDANKTQWAGWIMEGKGTRFFYSGDTGYAPHFKEIGDRYGPFQLSFLECGQYNFMWQYVHMLPEEVLQAAKDLKTEAMTPVHWGMYNLSLHDWFEPIERISRLAEDAKIPLWSSRVGALVTFPGQVPQDPWWRSHPDFKKRLSSKE